MARILCVEDEKDIRDVIAFNLRQAGYQVIATGSAQEATEKLAQNPTLVILDIMLPDASGIEICKTLKADARTKHIPVIMLTARDEEIDRVVGFEVGADDYIVKPFSMRELLLRVRAVLKRAGTDSTPPPTLIELGDLKIDRAAHRLWVGGKEIELTALEFRLLMTFYERRERVQSRGTLLDDVWGVSPDVITRTVDTHVKRLREKLESCGGMIETVRGVGYRFTLTPSAEA
jgi:two-component system phosphate regulon response regulator PhoB